MAEPRPRDEQQGAEIIPLGTRGRPGRGTGSPRPSSASRGLAGKVHRSLDTRAFGPEAHDPVVECGSEARVSRPTPYVVPDLLSAATAAAEEAFGEDADRKLAELIAFLRRRVTGDYEVDDYGLDAELTTRFLSAVVRPFAHTWFRVEVRGTENIPREGAALLVSNHSGTLPLDALVTMAMVLEHTGRHLRPLGADLVFRLPFVGELARKGGVTLACNEDSNRLLADGELVGVWPEGYKGLGKPYAERYQLQRFGRGGFVSAAVRAGAPIVPVSVVGAEEIYPMVGNLAPLARLLGAPYLPVTPFFPLLGPLGLVPLPSKWIIEFGEPIPTNHLDPSQADDPMVMFEVTDEVRETIQQTLHALIAQRGGVFG